MSTDPVSFKVQTDQPGERESVKQKRKPVDKGHAERIAKLFQTEYTRLVRYLFGRTRSLSEARDVASQAFAQILEMNDPQSVSYLKSYVYSIARNIWLDRIKIGAIHNRIDQIACYESDTTSPSPEPLLINGQRAYFLRKAIDGLKPHHKTVLVLRIWDELTFREIAMRLATDGVVVDERTVSNWYKDALEQLGLAVQGMAEDLKAERLG